MKLKLTIFVLLMVIQSGALMAKEIIHWYQSDSPPFIILRGPDKGTGSIDSVIKFFQERIPQYEHKNALSNLVRFEKQAKNGENWCHAWLLKTAEREKFLFYSDPATLVLPSHLIIKKENLALFGSQNQVSLEKIFKNKRIKGRVARSRSYGKKIDSLIERYKDVSNLKLVSQKEIQVLKMLLLDRIHYTINYPVVADYLAHQFNAAEKFISIPLKETQDIKKGYIGCARTPWGRQVIDQINQVLKKERTSQLYRKMVTELWLDRNSSRILNTHYDRIMFEN
ncbi:MAG: TIGR02285 family protein [SAR324 cluster bacterium]|nr:TIGR02285 family protein [SAR324 cluster bacterium]